MAKKTKPEDAAPEADNISSLQLELPVEPVAEPEANDAAVEPAADEPVLGVDAPELRPNVASTMRQWGYEVSDDATDDDVRAHLEELEDRASKFEQTQKELEQLKAWRAEAERRQAAPEPKAEPSPAPIAQADDDDLGIPDPPKLDTYALQMLRVAESAGKLSRGLGGVLTSEDISLQPHIAKYNQWLSEKETYDAEWGDTRKVAQHVAQKYADKAKAEAAAVRKEFEDWKAAQQQNTVQSQIDGHYEKHKAAYFDLDAAGNIQFDAQGNPIGARYAECVKAAQRAQYLGITDPLKIHEYVVEHVPPVAPAAPKAPEPPASKVVKFNNRLKNNGREPLPTNPVNRPAAVADNSKLSLHQQLTSLLPDLMAQKVADRM